MNEVRWRNAAITVACSFLMAACASTPASSFAEESFPEAAGVSHRPPATQEATATPSDAAEPSASARAVQLRTDSIAVSRVNNLRVRSAPGTAADQISTIDAGTRLFVLSGPATHPAEPDLQWWEVVPYACSPIDDDPAAGDCGYDPRIGWVTSGPEGLWVEPLAPDCPRELTAENPEAFYNPPELLACFGSAPIVLEGIVDYWCCRGITVGTTEPAWLAGDYSNPLVAQLRISEQEAASWGPELRINPASGLALGERGSVIRVTGHFDDPAASSCRTAVAERDLELNPDLRWVTNPSVGVYGCRLAFVIDAVERLDFVPLPTHAPQG